VCAPDEVAGVALGFAALVIPPACGCLAAPSCCHPERSGPDSLLRAELWRVGPRSRRISPPPSVLPRRPKKKTPYAFFLPLAPSPCSGRSLDRFLGPSFLSGHPSAPCASRFLTGKAGSFLGKRNRQGAMAKLFLDEGCAIPRRARAGRSQPIAAR